MRTEALETGLQRLLEKGCDAGVFSGAQAAVRWVGLGPTVHASAGYEDDGGTEAIAADTLFDVASLTKLFTASVTLRLAARGTVDLRERLGALLRELAATPQANATVEQVLAHEAGFVPWVPLFESVPRALRGSATCRQTMLNAVAAAPPAAAPDGVARYSDLGFISLGAFLERATRTPLDTLVEAEITSPLALHRTIFRPTARAVATAACPWTGTMLRGQVHDDNARAMGGVSGHAGLFSTASEMAMFGATWLDAIRGASEFLPLAISRKAVCRRPSGRGLGFDLKEATGSSAGSLISENAFGHLGFTGCSLWMDPERGIAVALLSNRVHKGTSLDAIRAFRPDFHDEVIRLVDRVGPCTANCER